MEGTLLCLIPGPLVGMVQSLTLEVGVETLSPAKVYEPLSGDGPPKERFGGQGSVAVVLSRASHWLLCSL